MDEAENILLQQKRVQLQLEMNIQERISGWLPVYNAIRQLNKPWSFEYVDCVTEGLIPFWEKALQKPLLANLGIPASAIKTPANYPVHNKMKALYPSRLSLRYMPALSHTVIYEADTGSVLSRAASSLHITGEEEVYFFYTRFTPVIRLPFSSIVLIRDQEIMTPEDICIMPADFSWLIFRSLEYEWVWGSNTGKTKK